MNEKSRIVIAAAPVSTDEEFSRFQDLLKAARVLSELNNCEVRAFIWGSSGEEYASRLAEVCGLDVAVFNTDTSFVLPDQLQSLLTGEIEKINPCAVVFDHTVMMCAVAAAAALSTGYGCITGIESIDREGENILFKRAVFNGKLNASLKDSDQRIFITVMAGAFKNREGVKSGANGNVEMINSQESDSRMKITALENSSGEDSSLDSADVVVSVGRGIGSAENIDVARELVSIFKNPALGASRTVCDMEWLPYSHQIGVTGRTVSPKLYVACGISGAQQHVAGMRDSLLIVSINNDPLASIFGISDYIVVEDIRSFIPLLIESYSGRK